MDAGKWFWKQGHIAINLGGVLIAFGIAFGGLFWVQNRMAREEAELLQGGGRLEIPAQGGDVGAQDSYEAESGKLSETELAQAVKDLRKEAEAYPHEPGPGQLSMAEAIECGKMWLEDYFLPYFGETEGGLREYRANCYLWSHQGSESGDNGACGYWTVFFGGKDMEAELILHAESGQVLDASVSCQMTEEAAKEEALDIFLRDYVRSFDLEDDEFWFWNEDKEEGGQSRVLGRSIGNSGVFAYVKASLVIVGRTGQESHIAQYAEILQVQLSLDCTEP